MKILVTPIPNLAEINLAVVMNFFVSQPTAHTNNILMNRNYRS